MKINGFEATGYVAAEGMGKGQGAVEKQPPGQVKKAQIDPEDVVEVGEKVPGVIRLLQEGHFKGVADVRLRIAHFEQIQALNEAATAEQKAGGVENFTTQMGAELMKLEEGLGLSEEQQAGFADLKGKLEEALAGASGVDGAAMKAQLQGALDEFAAGITALMTPPPVEPPAPEEVSVTEEPIVGETEVVAGETEEETEPVVTEPPAETATEPPAVDPLEVFKAAFAEALAGLETSFAPVSVLPEVSAGSGHGRAYDKFLAQYQQMYGLTPSPVDVEG